MLGVNKDNREAVKSKAIEMILAGENISKIARILGISRNTIYYWAKSDVKFGKKVKPFLTRK